MNTLRDRFWLWGQTPGSHHRHDTFRLPGVNRMGPAEGARHFGIPNCCRVAMYESPMPPFDRDAAELRDLRRVVWSIVGAGGVTRNDDGWGDLDEVVRQAGMHANVSGGILDDFLTPKRRALFPPERLREMRARLREGAGRPLDLWVVCYEHELGEPIAAHLAECDVITFWTWQAENLRRLDENLERVAALTPGKRRLAGCYFWDYGGRRPLTPDLMEHQCDRLYQAIRRGLIEGVVFCSNCTADIGLETADTARRWIARVGDERLEGKTRSCSV